MNIIQFEMGLNKTVNLGNYESLKVQVGATISTSTETVDADQKELNKYLHASLETLILQHLQASRVTKGVKQRPAIREEY